MFNGFTETGIQFLKNLAANNNKEWFEEHRHTYEEHLLAPLRELVTALQIPLKTIDAEIETSPAINKTISKIYRDTRFSVDKSPLRTSQWLSFKRPAKVWGNVPEFYFYFTPEKYEFGVGFYSATPRNMEKIRNSILTYPERVKQIIDDYNNQNLFALEGENYKRPIANPLSAEFQEWFQKKTLCLSCRKELDKTFFSANLKDTLENGFEKNTALYQFLTESVI